jgi:hypothetical protein
MVALIMPAWRAANARYRPGPSVKGRFGWVMTELVGTVSEPTEMWGRTASRTLRTGALPLRIVKFFS